MSHVHPDGDTGSTIHVVDSRMDGVRHGMGGGKNDVFYAMTDGQTKNQIHIHAGGGDDKIIMDLGVSVSKMIQHGYHAFGDTGRDTFEFTNIKALRGTIVGRIDDFEATSDEIRIDGQKLDPFHPGDIRGLNVQIVAYQGQQWLEIKNADGGRALFAIEGARQVHLADGTWGEEAHFLPWNRVIPTNLPRVQFENPMNSLPDKLLMDFKGKALAVMGGHPNVTGTAASDWIMANRESNQIHGGAGADYINGHMGNDTIFGDDGNDLIDGGKGFDLIRGGAGADIIAGGSDADTVWGGAGSDVIYGGTERDQLFGEAGNDRLFGGPGDDYVSGGDGDDVISGGGGADRLVAGNGNDTLRGDLGNDNLSGEAGNDLVYGGGGNDVVHGNLGNDQLFGDAGNDTLSGSEGNDTLFGGAGNDVLYGGTGNDVLLGEDGDDLLHKSSGNGKFYGGAGADRIYGGTGNDFISGGIGNDRIFAGGGADTIAGGVGKDIISGGAGADHFVFASIQESRTDRGIDIITDFKHGSGDVIDVHAIDADLNKVGNQDFHFIGTSAFHGHAGELRYVDQGNGLMVLGDVNGDAKADFSISLVDIHALSGVDFIL
ncbi:calcium-binding protein [Paracoccus broussonetiae]|nr:calcium-binding protein [Paracoccus sp. CPCC 101403]